MNRKNVTVLDLANVSVDTDSSERQTLALFPIEQDGKKMLDHMLLVSTDGRTYVVPKLIDYRRLPEQKRAELVALDTNFRCGARF